MRQLLALQPPNTSTYSKRGQYTFISKFSSGLNFDRTGILSLNYPANWRIMQTCFIALFIPIPGGLPVDGTHAFLRPGRHNSPVQGLQHTLDGNQPRLKSVT